jgi:type I restriction enzyme S subunit
MGQDVVLLRRRSAEALSDYLQLVLRSPVVTQQIALLMIGSTFKRINVDEIKSLMIPHPPAAEQRAIADQVLNQSDKLDSLSRDAEQAIGLLTERRAALISAAVTGQIDVRHLAGAEAA